MQVVKQNYFGQILLFLVVLCFCETFSSVALTDQNNPKLLELFKELKSTSDIDESRKIEKIIWGVWNYSGLPEVDNLMAKGSSFLASGNHTDAIRIFDAVVALAPNFSEGWNKRATAHFLQKNFGKSMRDIAHTLRLEPRHFGALSGMGLILIEQGKNKAALKAFRLALRIHPNLPGAKYNSSILSKMLEGSQS